MNQQHRQEAQACVELLEQGKLTPQRLLDAFDEVTADEGKRQDLLYLQSAGLNPEWALLGMRMFVGGSWATEPQSEDQWPYQSVAEAIKDGWRIISFPNQALCLDENRTQGLGFEFILEKWR